MLTQGTPVNLEPLEMLETPAQAQSGQVHPLVCMFKEDC